MKKENGLPLTISQSMLLKNGWLTMSRNPVSRWQPNLSAGFLFRKPLSTDAAFTDNERGKRMVFSRITANRDTQFRFMTKMSEASYVCQIPYFSIDNARVIYTKRSKFVKNEHAWYTLERYER